MKYFQTWTWNAAIRSWPVIGECFYRFNQLICGLLTRHPPSATEWGYGGGDRIDVYCRWCDKPGSLTREEGLRRYPGMRKHFDIIEDIDKQNNGL